MADSPPMTLSIVLGIVSPLRRGPVPRGHTPRRTGMKELMGACRSAPKQWIGAHHTMQLAVSRTYDGVPSTRYV